MPEIAGLLAQTTTPLFLSLLTPPIRFQIIYNMAKTRKTTRRTCRIVDSSISLSPASPRKPSSILDTPRRTKLIYDAQRAAGKIPRK